MTKTPTKPRHPVKPDHPGIPSRLTLAAAPEFSMEAAAGDASAPLPRFRMVAYTGAAMRVAGWKFPVVVDLAGLGIPSQSRPIRFGHDQNSGVGHTDSIRIEGGQLVATGVISRDTSVAREVATSSKNGFPWQASLGANVDEFEFVKDRQKVIVNGREVTGPVNVIRKATLSEISFVDLGADGQTSATIAATADANSLPSEEQSSMETHELPDSTEQADSGRQPNPPAAPAPAAPATVTATAVPSGVDDVRAQAIAETQRIATVRRLCAGRFDEIETRAIREGWDEARCELEVLRASRPRGPAIHMADNTLTSRVLEAVCVMSGKIGKIEAHYDERTLEEVHKRFQGSIGLQELLLEAAWANGYTGRSFRDTRAVMRYAFSPRLEAGYSTIDIADILSNVANKFLLEGFFGVERAWRNICAVRNVSDFKTVTSYRLIGKDQYERVAPGGELKHGTLGQEKYTNKAETYGLILDIDREHIINDDLNAITLVPRKLGRGSGLKINDIFWSTFLANSDFFKVANNNYISGADTALSIDGLTKAEVTFMDQVDSDGKPIGVLPSILLVPTALSALGSQLFKSLELRDTTANQKFPITNPHQGKFRVEVSRYLANATYTGNSSKAWYLLAEPSDLPVIEVAFLNGQESPTIETADADFNKLGVQMRGYHDFGVALQDPRGGVKAKGEV